jgi:quercetin dioxygenase-like cupin family protein
MSFWDLKNLKLEAFRPGIFSKAEIGDRLIMAYMEIEAHQEDAGHEHPFDQCGIVVQGQIEMFIGDENKILAENETYFAPAGIKHGWKTSDKPAKILDVSIKQT